MYSYKVINNPDQHALSSAAVYVLNLLYKGSRAQRYSEFARLCREKAKSDSLYNYRYVELAIVFENRAFAYRMTRGELS